MVDHAFPFPSSNFIGFDRLWSDLESLSRANEKNFPRHNIVKNSETDFVIELALAGYTREDLEIEVEEGNLIVTGEPRTADDREYVHKGITGRRFKRVFRLAEHVVVDGADLENGILLIYLRLNLPENKKPMKVRIGGLDSEISDQELNAY